MRALRWLTPTLVRFSLVAISLAVVPLANMASAQVGPQWRLNLDEAEKLAMQTNRLVLIHFWAPWCGHCQTLENNVYAQPGVGPALESRFVPVRINLDDHAYSATSRLYEIQSIPTDIIITPSGRLVAKIPCPQDPRLYVAQLMRAAGNPPPTAIVAAGPAPNLYTPAPSVPPMSSASKASYPPPATPSAGDAASLSMYSNSSLASYTNHPTTLPGPADTSQPVYGAPAYSAAPTAVPASATTALTAQAPARPPLGLDGYCPVTLIERHHDTPNDARCWVQGNARWGVMHRGTVYLFVGLEEQKRFLADPDRYSPALSGNDPVLAFDQGRLVQGTRQFGTFFGDRIYLFSSAVNLAKFAQSTDVARRYAEEVRQAEATPHASMH